MLADGARCQGSRVFFSTEIAFGDPSSCACMQKMRLFVIVRRYFLPSIAPIKIVALLSVYIKC